MRVQEFNGKIFNPQVFDKYTEKAPNLKRNELVKNGVYEVKSKYKNLMTNQDGGDYIVVPIKGLLDGQVQNYDGVESMTPTSKETYAQGKPVFGRMKAWQEKDFENELTGVNWEKEMAGEVAEYYQGVDQDDLLAILKGVFAMSTADAGNKEFVEKHTSDVSNIGDGKVGATTLNNAVQKALGQNKNIITMAFMHSDVATNLENLQLLQYFLYNDANGIQRQLNVGTWSGRTVIIDDSLPTTDVYSETDDTEVVPGKEYFTKSGLTYKKVGSPRTEDIATYFEKHVGYVTYLLGKGAFEYENIGVKVPSETQRKAGENGGIDVLYTRQRHLVSPKWISYTRKAQETNSATAEELANGTNWELVNNNKAEGKKYVDHKAIPIIKMISRG